MAGVISVCQPGRLLSGGNGKDFSVLAVDRMQAKVQSLDLTRQRPLLLPMGSVELQQVDVQQWFRQHSGKVSSVLNGFRHPLHPRGANQQPAYTRKYVLASLTSITRAGLADTALPSVGRLQQRARSC